MILLVDNFDSFTFNLLHYIEGSTNLKVRVIRNNDNNLLHQDFTKYEGVVISPGPGLPKESGYLMKFISSIPTSTKVLGICLGFQAIAEHFGSQLSPMPRVLHGAQNELQIDANDVLYKNQSFPFLAAHYHSWGVKLTDLSSNLKSTATLEQFCMSFSHKNQPWFGMQYHPESILTPTGKKVIEQWLMQ